MRLPAERDNPVWQRLRTHDVEELWDHSISPHVAASYAARLALIEGLVREACATTCTVVDVGCAQGTLGLRLAEQGYAVTLVDVRPEALEYARERYDKGTVEFVAGRAEDLVAAGRQFDVAICTEVLEHLAAPTEMLRALSSLVRRGGIIVLTTPNAEYAFGRLRSFAATEQSVIDRAEPDSMDGDAHRFLFTKEELVTLVRGVGLSVRRAGFALPFWLEGHLKIRVGHRLLFRATGRIVVPRESLVAGRGAISRRTCSCLWLVAERK